MLKRLILIVALVVGAFAMAPSASQAAPLGMSAMAQQAAPSNIDKAYYYYYRPRRYYYRRYYRPRYYYYRPRRYYYYRRW